MTILKSYLVLMLSLLGGQCTLHAQDAKPAKEIVQTAMQAELDADKNDHTRWRYRDAKKDGTDTVSIVVETEYGSVKRVIIKNGQALTEAEARAEDERVQRFIHDPEKLAKQRRDGAQDGKNAEELLHMLPEAFTWKLVSEDAQRFTLHFEPNPIFSPPNMQGRVLGTMAGTLVVNKAQNRIETISGKLTQDVTIGWGLFGRLHEGGTFRVERREVKAVSCRTGPLCAGRAFARLFILASYLRSGRYAGLPLVGFENFRLRWLYARRRWHILPIHRLIVS